MTDVSLHNFHRQVDCTYDDERYSVRDNGAVLRHPSVCKQPRPTDNQWIFGRPNSQNDYMYISQVRIHRIVATAFHGEPPTPKHIVDHIDTNRRNNMPENLRWLTRLENALLNPITRKRIEFICCSIETFLANPSILRHNKLDRNLEWMRTVTLGEARNCKARLSIWANSNNKTKKPDDMVKHTTGFEKRIYKLLKKWEVGLDREPGLAMALTPWCAQYMWRADSYFPCCPNNFSIDPIEDYLQNIISGAVFSYSNYSDLCPRIIVHEVRLLKKKSSIVVMGKREDDTWSIIGIERDEKSKHFIHFILGSYAKKDEAYKQFLSKNEQTNFQSEGYAAWFHLHSL